MLCVTYHEPNSLEHMSSAMALCVCYHTLVYCADLVTGIGRLFQAALEALLGLEQTG